MKACLSIGFLIVAMGLLRVSAEPLSGSHVLDRIDENMYLDRAILTARMIIHGRAGDRTIESRSYRRGVDSVLVEYLAPPREKGKKMLKLGSQVWNYIPEPTDRIIAISGHLLRQAVMGSDLSYEDITENHRLRDLYEAVVEGDTLLDGRSCLVLALTASRSDVAYHARRVIVDTERWIPLHEERYAKSGKLLKTTRIEDVMSLGDRYYPRRIVFRDELARGGGTEYIVEEIDQSTEIPDYMLTKAALR
jgi:hypothetical protein